MSWGVQYISTMLFCAFTKLVSLTFCILTLFYCKCYATDPTDPIVYKHNGKFRYIMTLGKLGHFTLAAIISEIRKHNINLSQ